MTVACRCENPVGESIFVSGQRCKFRPALEISAGGGAGAGNASPVRCKFHRPMCQTAGKAFTIIVASVVLLSFVPGCTGTLRKQESAVSTAAERVAQRLEAVTTPAGTNVDGDSSGNVESTTQPPDPGHMDWLRSFGEIRIKGSAPLALPQILNRISSLSDVQFLVLAGPEGKVVVAGRSGPAVAGSGNSALQLNAELLAHDLGARYRPNHRGELPDVLDDIAAMYGLSWEFDGTSVIFRQFTTRTHQVAVLPSRTEYSVKVGAASTSGGIDLPSEIEAAVRSLAGSDGEVSFGRASGQFLVTARSENQRQVAKYIRELNGFLSRQVAFDVNVLTVSLSESESAGVDLDLFAGEEGGNSIRWTGNHGVSGASGTVNVGVLSGNVDLNVFIGALDRRGRVSVETRTGATTSNNRMVPVEVVSETAYARKVEAVSGPEGAARTTIEPGSLTTGFELNLLPRIMPDGVILLSYSIRLSDLNELVEFTSDRQTIQLPRTSTTSFEQQAIIGDNQTLVLMGFERSRKSHDRSASRGIPALFGGRAAAATDRIATVLMIRPRILPQRALAIHGTNSGGRFDGN